MCGHLDAPFAFVTRSRNVTVRFHTDRIHEASGFSIGYVTYSGTCHLRIPLLLHQLPVGLAVGFTAYRAHPFSSRVLV